MRKMVKKSDSKIKKPLPMAIHRKGNHFQDSWHYKKGDSAMPTYQ
jgi:hypothetical protein